VDASSDTRGKNECLLVLYTCDVCREILNIILFRVYGLMKVCGLFI
jgi:hypothetical protein